MMDINKEGVTKEISKLFKKKGKWSKLGLKVDFITMVYKRLKL